MIPKASSYINTEVMSCPTSSIASSHNDDGDSDSSTVPCEANIGTPLSSGSKAQPQAKYNMGIISQKRELLDGLPVPPIWSRQDGRKSILVAEKGISSLVRARRKLSRRVIFTNVYLREYGLTLGDNPSVSSGPPISLSWEYTPAEVMPLEDFELRDSEKRTSLELMVPKSLREKWLRNEWRVSQSDIAAAVREVNKIKHSRRKNFHKLTSTAGKVERVLSKVFDSKSKSSNSDREAARLERKHANAVADRKQRQFGKKLVRRESNGNGTDSSFSTDPTLEEALDENELLQVEARPKKSILKNKTSSEKRGHVKSFGKSVSFATHASTDEILCSVHEFKRLSGRFQWPDENQYGSLWWLPEEMEFRHELDLEIVASVEDQLQCLLIDALKSTKTSDASTDQEIISSSMVKLDFNHLAACDVARGLEKEVIPDVHSFVVKTHRSKVLAEQELFFQSTEIEDVDRQMEEIRRKSLRYSRPSRLLALKLGAYDEFIKPVAH